MTFKNLKQHLEIFANTDKIPNDAITNREKENEKDARELFVKGVADYSKEKE